MALPSLPALQLTLSCVLMLAVRVAGSLMVTLEMLLLHPYASITVTVYIPVGKLPAVGLVCPGVVFHVYVNGDIPPVTSTVALPSLPPLQLTLDWLLMDVLNTTFGSVMVTLDVVVQPFASVVVTVYMPAVSVVAGLVV